MQTYKYPITKLQEHQVLVGGTNTQGRHGKGSALTLVQLGKARYGQSIGWIGEQAYGIVTKDLTEKVHPSIPGKFIIDQIHTLYEMARSKSERQFLIMYRNAPNLNGYSPEDMAYYFALAGGIKQIPDNIVFEETFLPMVLKQRAAMIF